MRSRFFSFRRRRAGRGMDVHRRRSAFTLVELLIAFLILMLGITAVLSMFPVGVSLSRDMVETSTAALVARNVRGCMEATNLADALTPLQNGIPNINRNAFPSYFPADMDNSLVNDFLESISNDTVQPPIQGSRDGDRIIDTANPLYSWDARIDVGQGSHPLPWGFTQDEAHEWFSKYFRYYTVQISVYRNYKETQIPGGGSISIYDEDAQDINNAVICRLTLSGNVPSDIEVGYYVRFPDDRSAWYRIQEIDGNVLILDRAYAGDTGSKGNVIATGSLVGSFTTFLAAYNE